MKLFKGKIDIGNTTNNLLSKLDDSKLTEQEKSNLYMDFFKSSLSENSVRSRARRVISYAIIGNTFFILWYCLYLMHIGKSIEGVLKLADTFQLGWAFFGVISFFFGVHILRSFKDKNK